MQARFYETFSRGDLDAMMTIWSCEEAVVCIHPGGPPVVGAAAVRRSWSQILGAEDLKISASTMAEWINDDYATFVVTEHLYVPSQNIRAETLATNAFRREDSNWRMVLHHGSPKPVDARVTATGGSRSKELH